MVALAGAKRFPGGNAIAKIVRRDRCAPSRGRPAETKRLCEQLTKRLEPLHQDRRSLIVARLSAITSLCGLAPRLRLPMHAENCAPSGQKVSPCRKAIPKHNRDGRNGDFGISS